MKYNKTIRGIDKELLKELQARLDLSSYSKVINLALFTHGLGIELLHDIQVGKHFKPVKKSTPSTYSLDDQLHEIFVDKTSVYFGTHVGVILNAVMRILLEMSEQKLHAQLKLHGQLTLLK